MYQKEGNCIIPTVCSWSNFEYQKEGNCMIPTVCSWSRMCASERRKLYHTYSMFMLVIFCIRKHQKEGNRIIPTLCLCSRLCVLERGKLYHTYNMFILYILCMRKRETVSYLQYVHGLDFVYKKEENCVILTVCSWSIFCVSEREKLYHTYSMFMI